MTIFPSKNGPPNETIFAALGRLVFASTQLEDAVLLALISALGDSDEAEIVVVGMSFTQALQRLSVIYAALDHSAYDGGIGALCLELTQLNEARNRHIHSTWGFWLSGSPARTRRKLKGGTGLTLTIDAVNPKEVLQLAERMHNATEAVYHVRVLYIEHLRRARADYLASVSGS